ncbi:IPT/TIG domain-containing protein [Actinoplanes sp. NPDC051851]|uniref:beta strand repeat-containing protein n=1 Tax=Actinoplanes sp. NPDC051851 TaxID=3154753 RepID=UPI00343A8EE1
MATPAFAAVTVSPTGSLTPGAPITITDSTAPYTVGTVQLLFSQSACTTYSTSGNIAVSGSASSTSIVSVTVPPAITAGSWYACVYAAATGSSLTSASLTIVNPVTPLAGPATGTMTLTTTGSFTGATTLGTYFSTSSCGSTYSTTNVAAAATTRKDADTATLTIPSTITLNSNASRLYYVCTYGGTTAGTSALITNGTYTLAPLVTLGTTSGVSGGGNTINITVPTTSPVITSATMAKAGFAPSATGCPTAWASLDATRQTTVTRTTATTANTTGTVTIPTGVGGPNGSTFQFCLYDTAGTTLVAASAASAYSVTLSTATLNMTSGAGANSGTVLTITSANSSAFTTATSPAATFVPQTTTALTCPAVYTTTGATAAGDTRKLTSTKASVSLPAATVTKANGPAYTVCVYSSSSTTDGKLLAAATYTVVDVPDLTGVSPVSGPPGGGNVVVLTGTSLPESMTGTSITIGGVAVPTASITLTSTSSISVKVPAHAMGSANIVLTSTNGSDTLVGAYTYVNSLTVTPNTAPNTGTVTLDIFGTNFSTDYTFTSPTALTKSHVYLVKGDWNGGGASTSLRNNVNAAADCASVLVVDDTELICTLDLTRALNADGTQAAYSDAARTNVAAVGAASSTVLVATSTTAFTSADIGKAVSDYNSTDEDIPTGATIIAVTGNTAVLSDAVTADGVTAVDIGVIRDAVTAAGVTGAMTLTAATGTFTSADVGRVVTDDNTTDNDIPSGTYITGVNSTGTTATLSQAVLTDGVAAVDITSSNAVPPGAYNVVLVSNAVPTGTGTSSVVSSGSTFTVSAF